jgi:SP family arabinose:H+ symporter-like MFS transporter
MTASSSSRGTYVYLAAGAAAISGLLFGFDTAVINGALLFIRAQFRLTEIDTEVVASSLLCGCILGAACAGMLGDWLGRRKALLAVAALFCAAALGCAIPANVSQLIFARFWCGVAIGVASVLAPMYISEVSPAHIRGRLVALNQLAIVTGILLAYYVNWQLAAQGEGSWRWMFAVAAIPSAAFFAAMWWNPESPRWLARNGMEEKAYTILCRTMEESEARKELRQIEKSLQEESSARMSDLLRPGTRLALGIAIFLAVFQQVTGINTVLYYGSIIFKEMVGQSATNAVGANVAIGAVNLLCTIGSLFLVDRIGRRGLMLAGSAGMGLALLALGFAFHGGQPSIHWILGLILLYVACFALSLGPCVWIYIAEIFPNKIRGRAMSVATLALWTACLAVTLTFLSLMRWLSPAGTFWLYAALCAVMFVVVLWVLPETKQKSLEEIQAFWASGRSRVGR